MSADLFAVIDRQDVKHALARVEAALDQILYGTPIRLPGETEEEARRDHLDYHGDEAEDALAALTIALKRLEVLP